MVKLQGKDVADAEEDLAPTNEFSGVGIGMVETVPTGRGRGACSSAGERCGVRKLFPAAAQWRESGLGAVTGQQVF